MSSETAKVPVLLLAKNMALPEEIRQKENAAVPLKKSNYRIRMFFVSLWAAIVTFVVFGISLLTWGTTISGWIYARLLNFLGMRILGIKIKVDGRENLPKVPSVLLVNHQSNFDAFYLGGIFPRHSVVVAKREMLKVPLFGVTLKAVRTIFVDRDDSADAKKGLKKAIDTIKKDKNHIWIFPEGTRSQGKGLGEFKKGAFAMAIASGAPIVPIVSETMERLLDTQKKTLFKGEHRVHILPAIPTEGMKFRDIDKLLAEVTQLFQHELKMFETTKI
ncbi:MAG: hypothetical protein LDLANPLL_02378 [Turneriella sp.]|nr:hypothetical protein [Turneriella sp.]